MTIKMYLYQNRTTGKPSSSPLSALQLCRILCPPSKAPTATTIKSDIVEINKNTCLIQANTLLLGFDPSTGQYSNEGWKPAKSIDIIREACATWYFEGEGRKVLGPVSAHTLAVFFFRQDDVNNDNDSKIEINEKTRVWSQDIATASSWKSIDELPNLRMLFDLFRDSIVKDAQAETLLNKEGREFSAKENGKKLEDIDQKQNHEMDEEASRELAAFLSNHHDESKYDDEENDEENDDEEGFESDGGTFYVKNTTTGDWMPSKKRPRSTNNESGKTQKLPKVNIANINSAISKKKKKKKTKFAAKNAKQWIYVTGLPTDTNEDEVAKYFSKAGILQLDPESQRSKIKLYRHKSTTDGKPKIGGLKGDASICYARAESVDLALQILDESMYRPESKTPIQVKRAKFEQHGDTFQDTGRNKSISLAKRKVARLAALQAVGWDEGENGRITGGLKGLRIIVLKGIFSLPKKVFSPGNTEQLSDDVLNRIESQLHSRCSTYGSVEKITIFSKNRDGVVIVKFSQPTAASDAARSLDGTMWGEETRPVIATFWDGVTDFTIKEEEKELKEQEKRHEEFGDWLDNQELPDEFRLQVES